MKKMLIKFLLLIIILSFTQLQLTNSNMEDRETSGGNTLQAGCWGEGIVCVTNSPLVFLRLYPRDDHHAVGFSLGGISPFSSLDYEVRYRRDNDGGEVEESASGSLDNSSGDDSKTYEWIFLGTCTSGGTCTNHEGVEEVSLEVTLHGPFDRSLSTSISL
jgi:hypothetical protein